MLRGSSVSWVWDITTQSLLCVWGDSKLEVYDSTFHENVARPIAMFNQSSLLLYASNLTNNSVVGASGVGMVLRDHAKVTITGKSRVHGNLARFFGGGLFATDRAVLRVQGNSLSQC